MLGLLSFIVLLYIQYFKVFAKLYFYVKMSHECFTLLIYFKFSSILYLFSA